MKQETAAERVAAILRQQAEQSREDAERIAALAEQQKADESK